MGAPRNILVQLDSDPLASVFDAIVGLDAGVDQLLQYGNVDPENVTSLVHGAIFTRGLAHLHHTAIFIGGRDVPMGERLLDRVRQAFFGPLRVSVMLDSNGSNTTAVATLMAAANHVDLASCSTVLWGATGPVGQRLALLLARHGGTVHLISRSLSRADSLCQRLVERGVAAERLVPSEIEDDLAIRSALRSSQLVIAAGAAGVEFTSLAAVQSAGSPAAVIDLNAVPPLGIRGVDVSDRAQNRHGATCYGALGIGGLKMKLHRAAIQGLFTRNDQVFDLEELYRLGQEWLATS